MAGVQKIDLHEVYASFSGDRLKAAASEAFRTGNDDEADFCARGDG